MDAPTPAPTPPPTPAPTSGRAGPVRQRTASRRTTRNDGSTATTAAGAQLLGERTRSAPSLDGLARSSSAEVAEAWAHRDALVACAELVHRLAQHDPDLGSCSAAGCGLAALDDGPQLCALSDRLARLATPPPGPTPAVDTELATVVDTELATAVDRLRDALPAAVDAVRECRRSPHPDLPCWFADVPGLDGCAAVLRAAHRCG